MVAFNTALLPSGTAEITTVEELKVWVDLILHDQAGGGQLTRVEGEKLISVCARTFYDDKDKIPRMEVFSHMRLIPNWEVVSPNIAVWKKVVTLAETSIPADFSRDN